MPAPAHPSAARSPTGRTVIQSRSARRRRNSATRDRTSRPNRYSVPLSATQTQLGARGRASRPNRYSVPLSATQTQFGNARPHLAAEPLFSPAERDSDATRRARAHVAAEPVFGPAQRDADAARRARPHLAAEPSFSPAERDADATRRRPARPAASTPLSLRARPDVGAVVPAGRAQMRRHLGPIAEWHFVLAQRAKDATRLGGGAGGPPPAAGGVAAPVRAPSMRSGPSRPDGALSGARPTHARQ
jgi:hypothetical protein